MRCERRAGKPKQGSLLPNGMINKPKVSYRDIVLVKLGQWWWIAQYPIRCSRLMGSSWAQSAASATPSPPLWVGIWSGWAAG